MGHRLDNWLQELNSEAAADEYDVLCRSLRRKKGFGLFFVQCNSEERKSIEESLHLDIQDKEIAVLNLTKPINSLYDEVEAVSGIDEANILFISGLEYSFCEYEKSVYEGSFSDGKKELSHDWRGVPRFLGHLNLQRDRFREDFDLSFVFFLDPSSIDYFIRRAPDLFDWRNGLYRFGST